MEHPNKEVSQNDDSGSVPIHFDIERMYKALQGESVTMPPGLTREEKRQFTLDYAAKNL